MAAAAKDPNDDAIHDVRVAIRRLRQCLAVFRPLLPCRSTRGIDRKVHKTLRAAGRVRNFDIAIKLVKRSEPRGAAGLIHELRRDRRDAAAKFRRALKRLDDGRAAEGWRLRLLAEQAAASPEPLEYARTVLPELAGDFFDAGDAAANPGAGYRKLHKFRIQGKKLRYTLELFASDYGASLLPRMRTLRNVQTRLGDINDYVTTAGLLKNYRKGHRATVDSVIERVERLAAKGTAAFRRNWPQTLGARRKNDWVRYLGGVAGKQVA